MKISASSGGMRGSIALSGLGKFFNVERQMDSRLSKNHCGQRIGLDLSKNKEYIHIHSGIGNYILDNGTNFGMMAA
jgi:hypothetical protein